MLQSRVQLILAMLASILGGCGAATMPVADAADMALNTITDTAQPAYEVVKDYCSQKQWAIIHSDRPVTQKEAAVSKVRSRCHKVYELFEQLIQKQAEARKVIAASREGTFPALKALAQVKEIQALMKEAHSQMLKLMED